MRRLAAALLCLALLPAGLLLWTHPGVPHLGYFHDDSIYWVCARSLAAGAGYRIASLPGEPYQTKFPPLYPWLLSLVWRLNGAFPGNLAAAACLNFLFLPAYLLLAWRWFGDFGLSPAARACLAGALAVSPYVVFFTLSLLPELIFSCLLMAALVLCGCAERSGSRKTAAAAGLLGGVAFLARSAALPLLASAPLVFLIRKRRAAAGLFMAGMFPAVAAWQWWVWIHGPRGGDEVWLFYTSYAGQWQRAVSWSEWPGMVWMNLHYLVRAAGDLTAFQLSGSAAGLACSHVLAAGALAGCCRLARSGAGLHGLAFAALYLAVLLNWNYPPNERLLFPVFPVLLAGLAREILRLADAMRMSRAPAAAAAAGVLGFLTMAAATRNGQALAGFLPDLLRQRRAVTDEHRAAYDWLDRHLPPGVNAVADHDGMLYLYTGRKAVRLLLPVGPAFTGDMGPIRRAARSLPDFARTHRAGVHISTSVDFEQDLRQQGGFDPAPFLGERIYRSEGVAISRIR